MALALPPGGKIICCDVSEEWTAVARRHWKMAGVEKKISLRLAPALETLKTLKGKFDFAFIDADKTNYQNYYERCLKFMRKGGLIAIDNTLWHGSVIDRKDRAADAKRDPRLQQETARRPPRRHFPGADRRRVTLALKR